MGDTAREIKAKLDEGARLRKEIQTERRKDEQTRKDWLRKAVIAPLEEAAQILRSGTGLKTKVSHREHASEVAAEVGGRRFQVFYDFDAQGAKELHFARTPRTTGAANMPVRGMDPDKVAEKVGQEFKQFIRNAFLT